MDYPPLPAPALVLRGKKKGSRTETHLDNYWTSEQIYAYLDTLVGNVIPSVPKMARVVVEAWTTDEHLLETTEAQMSTDLPAQNLGEVISETVAKAWGTGIEPKDFTLKVRFS